MKTMKGIKFLLFFMVFMSFMVEHLLAKKSRFELQRY